MKKTIIAISLLSAMLLTACGGEEAVQADVTVDTVSEVQQTEETAAEATASDVTAAVMSEIEIPSAIEKNAENIGAFYDVDTASVAEMSVFICGSGAYPDELAVFKFNDADSAKAGAEAVQKRLDEQISVYTDYTPDEMYKLNDAVLITKDNWVVFAACSDNARAKEIIEGLI